ncbi:thioredoxin [Streptococcus dentasini]
MNSSKKIWLIFLAVIIIVLSGIKVGISAFVKDYDKHLSAAVYQKTVVDQDVNLVFYKPGCPYCRAGKQAVIKAAEDSPYPTYYIDVESESGKELVNYYGVRKAATVIKVRKGTSQSFIYAKNGRGKEKMADSNQIKEAFDDGK